MPQALVVKLTSIPGAPASTPSTYEKAWLQAATEGLAGPHPGRSAQTALPTCPNFDGDVFRAYLRPFNISLQVNQTLRIMTRRRRQTG